MIAFRLLQLAVFFLVTTAAARAEISIFLGPVTNPSNGHIYYALTPTTWAASEAYAVSMGGHLATIRNATEDAWVFATFNQGDPNRPLWMGFNDAAVEGTWVWSSGEPVTYTHWGVGEPNNLGNEDYGSYFATVPNSGAEVGSWNDAPATFEAYGVVEIVPEPGIFGLLGGALLATAWTRRRRR